MEANGYVLALYLISGAMGVGCALLKGSSVAGRVVCLATGLALLAWGSNAYLFGDWALHSSVLLLVPLVFGGYALRTVRAQIRRARLAAAAGPATVSFSGSGPGGVERRRAGRRPLPGEIGDTPVNVMPAAHDPWAALYAASQRKQLRELAVQEEIARAAAVREEELRRVLADD